MKSLSYLLVFVWALFLQVYPMQAQVSMQAPSKASEQKQIQTIRTPSQNLLPPKKVQLLYEIETLEEEFMETNFSDPANFSEEKMAAQKQEAKVLLHLFSTANIEQIHVKIGTSPGAADFAAHSFTFDDTKNMTAPFTFVRDGKTVVLGMGMVTGAPLYHVEVRLQGRGGQLSEPAYFTNQ